MRQLLTLVFLMIRAERPALLRGALLAIVVLAMGVGLLGLSGWFITASAAAGLAGIGILFNVFAPSAMVRFLALGRTVARYGERLLTHDATLRALSQLRIHLLSGLLNRPHRELERLRANAFLNRVTADVDALDGALLRLILPGLAGAAVIVLSAFLLAVLVHPVVGAIIGVGYLVLPTVVFVIGQRLARRPSRQAEAAMQAGRSRLIDLIAGRDDLTVYGQLPAAADHTRQAFARHSFERRKLDRIERRTGGMLDLIGAIITAAALAVGIALVQAGEITAARAAIGVFAALALSEAIAPIRRALSEIGRMTQAARRILPSVADLKTPEAAEQITASPTLMLEHVGYRRSDSGRELFRDVSLRVQPGETVALTGASGCGKSTILLLAAGALEPTQGRVSWAGRQITDWSRDTIGQTIALVPQRHALIAGSIGENLRLADPGASDETLWHVLELVCLADTVRARGGLTTALGFRGAGLSGGEARRLVLARAILRRPDLLLLDEPTEGLDDPTARTVMRNLRLALPKAAILMAAHRAAEIATADRTVALSLFHP